MNIDTLPQNESQSCVVFKDIYLTTSIVRILPLVLGPTTETAIYLAASRKINRGKTLNNRIYNYIGNIFQYSKFKWLKLEYVLDPNGWKCL